MSRSFWVLGWGRALKTFLAVFAVELVLVIDPIVLAFSGVDDVRCAEGDAWRSVSAGADRLGLDGRTFRVRYVPFDPPLKTGDYVEACWVPLAMEESLVSLRRGGQIWHSRYERNPSGAALPMFLRSLRLFWALPLLLLLQFSSDLNERLSRWRRSRGKFPGAPGRGS